MLEQRGILGDDGSSGGAIKVLCAGRVSAEDGAGCLRGVAMPSLILAMPGCWACEEMGALLAGVFWGVL